MKTVSHTALRGRSLVETAYLLRNPANAAHLRRGLTQVEARKTRRRKLLK
jgi:PHD/YefM family antitoxin component YafN of YafNO toxin-antitoxin module